MIDKFYQVFVSSTFSDLKEERQQVSNTLAKAGYVAAGMELFPASDEQQLDYIKRIIDRSDYYVVIVGARYGSVDEHGVSFTEREFEYAQSKSIPVLAFLHAAPETIAVGKTDEDFEKKSKLENFRSRLKTGRLIESWTDKNELCTKVMIAVANAVNLTPGMGWIRGDNAIDPKLLQDLARLRNENVELRAKLEKFTSGDLAFDPALVGPNDAILVEVKLNRKDQNGATLSKEDKSISVRLGDLFAALYDELLKVPSEHGLQRNIAHAALEAVGDELSRNDYAEVPMQTVINLRHQLEGLGLIQASSRPGAAQGIRYICWEVADKGRRYVSSRKVERKA